MSGVELPERFAKLADAPPVVVITGNDDLRVRDQCIALGAQRYFRKPLDCDALLEAAGETVGR
jgi:FixJ family two-component response regulator